MGYLSCYAESSIATCDPYNWELLTRKQRTHNRSNNNNQFEIRDFSYSDLDSATNGFSAESFLGKGSHGSVYRAVLDHGKLVAAVKKTKMIPKSQSINGCNNCSNNPAENEIEILSRVRSPRLVNLLGYGVDLMDRKLIVVELMPNGSLYDLLHSSVRPPGWGRRVRFALQIGKAVQHLHSSNPPVIHRDIKSSNVLIDGDWNARLGDFGLALRGHVEDVRVKCTPPAGTLGYLDPGYLAPGDLSAKSDVFSFGILLLELISGRNAIDMNYSPPSVVDWAAPLIRAGEYESICDPRIGSPEDPAVIRQLAVIAARCVRSTAAKRPPISEVVELLKGVKKRPSPLIWNNIGQRVGRRVRKQSQSIKYEALDDDNGHTEKIETSRSRRNRKVSSVPGTPLGEEGASSSSHDRVVGRSKSVGSGRETKCEPSDGNVGRRRVGLAVMMPTVRLNKSRSTGMLQSNTNGGGYVVEVVKNPNIGGEMEESKLLIHMEETSLKEEEEDASNNIITTTIMN